MLGKRRDRLRRKRDVAVGQVLHEPEPRSSAFTRPNLELVCDGADDGDAQSTLAELCGRALGRIGLEALALVADLDLERAGGQLVRDLDVPVLVRIGVADRVRARLGDREL